MDMAGRRGNEIPCFLSPFHAGDRMRIVHEILKTDILQFFDGIKAIAIKVVKRRLGFVDMHQNKSRALHLPRAFQPQAFGKPFDERRFPAPELSFKAEDHPGFKLRGNALGKIDRFLSGGCRNRSFFHFRNVKNLFVKV